jgi:aspartate aminotransferase
MPSSPIRKLVPFADQAKKEGKTVFHLNIGQPDIETPKPFLDAIRSFDQNVLAYSPSKGLLELRERMSGYYAKLNIDINPEQIQITEGGSEAVLFTYSVITDPGDEIIVFEPFYANYNGFAHTLGISLVPITLDIEDGYRLPPKEKIVSHITDKTKAIQVCNPSNPTGTVLTSDEVEMLIEIASENDIFILSDEVYREITFDSTKSVSLLDYPDMDQLGVVFDSVSKQFSACGARIGALISRNEELLARALKYAQARLSPPTMGQIGAIAAYSMSPEDSKPIWEQYRKRRDTVVAGLKHMDDVVYSTPAGTFYIMARLPVENSEDFARFLLTDFDVQGETVMVAPGSGFYATEGKGINEIRIAFVLEIHSLEKAVAILKQGLEAYNKS